MESPAWRLQHGGAHPQKALSTEKGIRRPNRAGCSELHFYSHERAGGPGVQQALRADASRDRISCRVQLLG